KPTTEARRKSKEGSFRFFNLSNLSLFLPLRFLRSSVFQGLGLRFNWLFTVGFFRLLLLFAEQWEQDHVSDGARIGQQHSEPVNADAFAAGRRQPVRERTDVVFIHGVGLFVAALFLF